MGEDPYINDFGDLNGYSEIPEEIQNCWEQNHPLEGRNIGNCYNHYYCIKCNIGYNIDSSG